MSPDGDLREMQPDEKLRPREIEVPAEKVPEVQRMTRQQRRAWYRAQQKAARRG